eukprot:m.338770 g.338770  ORF g.338770 m.338770 type:complete len:100 (-) comp55737_c0_seq13:303-602(-)
MNLISVALYFDAVFRNIVVQMFLDHGADIHLKNKAGETATSLARGRSRTNIMELLEDIGWRTRNTWPILVPTPSLLFAHQSMQFLCQTNQRSKSQLQLL